MASQPRYRYRPLESPGTLRLLILDAAPADRDPLTCTIVHCQRDSPDADYCAISYAWGKPVFTRFLHIRSADGLSRLKITATVDALLRRMRSFGAHRLWIDAVCLDQQDQVEKGFQIPVMGQIYRQAKTVHIWLGPHDEYTEATFKALDTICMDPSQNYLEIAGRISQGLKGVAKLEDNPLVFKNVMVFHQKPWFQRRWVVQEACLARHALVHCGEYSMDFSTLVQAARKLVTGGLLSYALIAELQPPGDDTTLLELLYRFESTKCFDKRDCIAAFYGLLPKASQFPFDYNEHWTDCYRQVVLHLMANGDQDTRFQVLRHVFEFGSAIDSAQPSLPSWIPDWSKERNPALPRPMISYHSPIPLLSTHTSKFTSATCTSLELYGQMLKVSWNSADSCNISEHYCQTVADTCNFLPSDMASGNLLARLRRFNPPSSPPTLSDMSLLTMICAAAGMPPDEDEQHRKLPTGLVPDPRTPEMLTPLQGSIQMLLMAAIYTPGETISICKLGRQHECSTHDGGSAGCRTGPLNALFAIATVRMEKGDYLVPLWDEREPEPPYGWPPHLREDRQGGSAPPNLGLMQMAIVRAPGRPLVTADEKKNANDPRATRVIRGKLRGSAVAIYVKQEGASGIGKDKKKEPSSIQRCSILLV